jgi:subtilisin family serine protease
MTVARRILPAAISARVLARSISALAIVVSATACRVDDSVSVDPVTVPPKSTASIGAAIPGQYVVVLRDSVVDVDRAAARLLRSSNATMGRSYGRALKGFSATLSQDAAIALSQNPAVAFVEPDRVVTANETQSAPWATDRIDQRSLPLSLTYSWTSTGAGVNVYILDTGILTTHPQFQGRASSAYDVFGTGWDPTACTDHGTFVAGLVGSSEYGVAKAVNLRSVRVLDCSAIGTTSGVIAGVNWLISNRVLPAVANMSFGMPKSDALNQAVQALINAGVAVTVSAGNITISDQGSDACQNSPASVSAAITVGGTLANDGMASWSKRGACVDLFAPGHSVYSTGIYVTGEPGVANKTGSSASAALTAGAAALYLQSNPTASPSSVSSAVIGAATAGALTGLDAASPNRLLYTGTGAQSPDPTPPPPPTDKAPTAALTVSCKKTVCTFDGARSSDDLGIVRYEWNYGDNKSDITTSAKISHTYAAAGTYTATLSVFDAKGQTGRKSYTVKLKAR